MSRPLGRHGRWLALLGFALAIHGCELSEQSVTMPEDVIVAEGQLVLGLDLQDSVVPPEMILTVFLHRTFGPGTDGAVEGATVIARDEEGGEVALRRASRSQCFAIDPDEEEIDPQLLEGTCYEAFARPGFSPFEPGEAVTLEIETRDGRSLIATTEVPGRFALEGLAQNGGVCWLAPSTTYTFQWTPSMGTWAYLAETTILGLDVALADDGIEAPDELFLNGLSIGEDDTEIVFPSEFGIFDRFDLDRDLAVALQTGLPDGTQADVAISSMDRNWVNWERGGNFNPSGAVRIPSVFGDGTGVFGSAVRQAVRIVSDANQPAGVPACGS